MVVTRTPIASLKPEPEAPKKSSSGLKVFKQGELLFSDGDFAESLYIIQKGQIRLYKPKGRGFVDIAVLRAGEVIGEMAYFDNDGSGRRRSASAEAMTDVEVIEVTFQAFDKTIQGLNPWFKTIINTISSRLRKANGRIRELETNSVSHNYGGGGSNTYEFIKSADLVKILSLLYLTFKSHGERHASGVALNRNALNFYTSEVFNLHESRVDEILNILISMEFLGIANDFEGNPKLLVAKNLEMIRSFLLFFNSERVTPDDKRLIIPLRCEMFLEKILEQLANIQAEKGTANLSKIIESFRSKSLMVDLPDLKNAREAGFVGEVLVGENNTLSCEVDLAKLRNSMPQIRMMNKISKINDEKSGF